jgi:hypothetical protein
MGLVEIGLMSLVSLISAGVGAYSGSFLTEKGKNRAMRADIAKIVEQVQRTTKAAEEVRAAISDDLWLRQRRWDLRRDVYAQLLEALESLAQSLSIMTGADAAARTRAEVRDIEGATFHKQRYEMARERALEALRNARRAHALGGMFLPIEARAVVEDLAAAWNTALEESSRGAVGAFSELSKIIDRNQKALTSIARMDLMEGER